VPAVYGAGWATSSSAWVLVQLELVDPDEVFELLEEAWRMTATKRAITALDEARGERRVDHDGHGQLEARSASAASSQRSQFIA
jgi:hypothetical protein